MQFVLPLRCGGVEWSAPASPVPTGMWELLVCDLVVGALPRQCAGVNYAVQICMVVWCRSSWVCSQVHAAHDAARLGCRCSSARTRAPPPLSPLRLIVHRQAEAQFRPLKSIIAVQFGSSHG